MEAQGGFVPLVVVKECGVMGKPGCGHINVDWVGPWASMQRVGGGENDAQSIVGVGWTKVCPRKAHTRGRGLASSV